MKTITPFAYILILFFACFSCNSEKVSHPILLQAESLMENYPDSSLVLLQSIQQPQELDKAELALYALLLTKAEDKNYITHTSDSLIQIAVNYYDGTKDKYRQAESYFYLGSVYRDLNVDMLAIEMFQNAERLMISDFSNDRLLYLIYNNLGTLYEKQLFHQKSKEIYQKAIGISDIRKDSIDMIYPLRNLGRAYLNINQLDSSLIYYEEALNIATKKRKINLVSKISNEIACVYVFKENMDEAQEYISRSIELSTDILDLYSSYQLKGKIFKNQSNLDSARIYLLLSKESSNMYTKASSYFELYEVEKRSGNMKKSLEYIDAFHAFDNTLYAGSSKDDVLNSINKHTIKIQNNISAVKQKQDNMYYIILFLCFSIISFSFFFIWDHHRKKNIIKLHGELLDLQTKALVLDLDNVEQTNTVNKCQDEILVFAKLFRNEECYFKMQELALEVKATQEYLPRGERTYIINSLRKIFFPVMNELKVRYKMTDIDADFCVLSYLGFSNIECSGFLANSIGALKTRKSRIKEKLDSEMFSFLFHAKD